MWLIERSFQWATPSCPPSRETPSVLCVSNEGRQNEKASLRPSPTPLDGPSCHNWILKQQRSTWWRSLFLIRSTLSDKILTNRCKSLHCGRFSEILVHFLSDCKMGTNEFFGKFPWKKNQLAESAEKRQTFENLSSIKTPASLHQSPQSHPHFFSLPLMQFVLLLVSWWWSSHWLVCYWCCFLMCRLYTDGRMRWWGWWGVFVEECEARGGAAGSGDQTELVPQVRSLSFPASDLLRIHLKLLFIFLSSAAVTPAAEKQLKTVEKQCCDVEWIISAA